MNTLRSFKRCGAKGLYRQMSCRGIARQSAVLYRLLTQTIESSVSNRFCQKSLKLKNEASRDYSKPFLYVL